MLATKSKLLRKWCSWPRSSCGPPPRLDEGFIFRAFDSGYSVSSSTPRGEWPWPRGPAGRSRGVCPPAWRGYCGVLVEVETGKRFHNRPELAKALEAARKGKATLLIAKLDWLARNVAFIANLMDAASISSHAINPLPLG